MSLNKVHWKLCVSGVLKKIPKIIHITECDSRCQFAYSSDFITKGQSTSSCFSFTSHHAIQHWCTGVNRPMYLLSQIVYENVRDTIQIQTLYTILYNFTKSEWVDRKFHMNVGQAEFAPRSNKLEDQINSFSYGMKFSYPQYLGRVILRKKNTTDVPHFTWFKRSWTSLMKNVDLSIKKEMCPGNILTQVISFFTIWWNHTVRLIMVIGLSRVQFV